MRQFILTFELSSSSVLELWFEETECKFRIARIIEMLLMNTIIDGNQKHNTAARMALREFLVHLGEHTSPSLFNVITLISGRRTETVILYIHIKVRMHL